MRLYPPRSDEHATPQHAKHLPRILQRAPLLRWLEKARQSLSARAEMLRKLTSMCRWIALTLLILQWWSSYYSLCSLLRPLTFWQPGLKHNHMLSSREEIISCEDKLQPTWTVIIHCAATKGQSWSWLYTPTTQVTKKTEKAFSECILSLNPFVIISFASHSS